MITCTFEDGGKGKLRHICVSTILLNKEKNKILLVRRSALYSEPHKLALPGGFLGRDETTLDAAKREAYEESGYTVNVVSLFRINDNPNRPKEDRQNIDFIFLAETVEKVTEHDKEIENVLWFDLDQLPDDQEFAFDHYDSVRYYLEYQKEKFLLPIIGNKIPDKPE